VGGDGEGAARTWDVRRVLEPPLNTIRGALAALADEFDDKVAVDGDDAQITFRALAERANAIAHAVKAEHDDPSAPVALVVGHSASAVAALLGVFASGMVASPFDAREPVDRMTVMLRASHATLVLTDHANRDVAHTASGGARLLLLEDVQTSAPPCPLPQPGPTTPGHVMFTSGTTGVPKGVVFPQATTVTGSVPWAVQECMTAANRVPQLNSIAYMGGLARVLTTLLCGGTSCVFDLKERGLRELPAWMREKAVNVLTVSSSTFRSLAEFVDQPIEAVHRVNLGGETTYGTDVHLARRMFGPDVVVANMLGSTEAGGIAAYEVEPGTDPGDDALPVGRVAISAHVEIVDDDDRPVPSGEPGRIVVVKDTMALGYWDDPGLTAEHFFTSPDGRPGFRTSDIGRFRADGMLELVGRLDSRVKVRGALVATDEVERAFVALDGVAEASVVALAADDGGNRLVAYVVPAEGATPAPWQLRRDVAQGIPSTMVPATVVLVAALPRGRTGKVDRAALPSPPPTRPYCAPHGHQRELAEVFADVLGLERVGLDDDFFELGGDSLGALELMAAVADRFGVEMTATALLDAPTPAELAPRLGSRRPRHAPLAVPFGAAAAGAPFFCVPGGGAPALTLRALAGALGDLRFAALQARGLEEQALPDRSVRALARRNVHEIHRASPVGPYRLGGFSFGGLVAFETAVVLEQAGERVPVLVLIDTPAPGQLPTAVARVGSRLASRWSDETRSRSHVHALGAAREIARAARVDTRRRARLATAGIVPRQGLAQYELFLSLHERCAVRYRPRQNFAGPATVVRCVPAGGELPLPLDFGWSRWVDGPITVIELAGEHLDVLRAPMVTELGARLREVLRPAGRP
jgi:acyl-coenzyme A synthetase/AMP-(fatty) acid ligase/thioesterase domain-containing protein/acyl carrier protein